VISTLSTELQRKVLALALALDLKAKSLALALKAKSLLTSLTFFVLLYAKSSVKT